MTARTLTYTSSSYGASFTPHLGIGGLGPCGDKGSIVSRLGIERPKTSLFSKLKTDKTGR
jgi:hypothetical protein